MSVESIDLRIKLLSGEPIFVEGAGYLKPLRLRDIARSGYSTYLMHLNVLTASLKDLTGKDDIGDGDLQLSTFDLLLGSEDLALQFVEAVKYFFGVEYAQYFPEFHNIVFGDGNKFINRETYLKVKEVLEYQNYLTDPNMKRKQFTPKDERARLLMEHRERTRAIVNKIKGATSDQPDFVDIISSVSTRSNTVGKHDVWELTIYELYDEFSRLRMIDDFEISIKAQMAGASNIDIKHWSSKVNNE